MPKTFVHTVETDLEIFTRFGREGESAAMIGNDLGMSRHAVRGRYLQLEEEFRKYLEGKDAPAAGGYLKDEEADDERSINSLSPYVKTVEDALAKGNVDMDVWEVDRHVLNSWEVGAKTEDGTIAVTPLWQVKVWLRRKVQRDDEQIVAELIERLSDHAPAYDFAELTTPTGNHLLEICIPDLHVGKLAWDREVGEDYDIRIARTLYLEAVEQLLRRASGVDIQEILFVVGNDMLHVDNLMNTTTGGTPQDVDGRWQKSFVQAHMMVVEAIERCAAVAPVKVLVVPGNHDYERMFYLGHALACTFEKAGNRVVVDNAPTPRKYYRYGQTLLGFTHGNEEKAADLPLIMAQECRHEWSDVTYGEWHIGHLHKRAQTRFTAGDTINGVGVRILPSLSGTDAWHNKKGYVKGPRAAEAYLWHYTEGYAGHFNWNAA